jgi:hypothetical protein
MGERKGDERTRWGESGDLLDRGLDMTYHAASRTDQTIYLRYTRWALLRYGLWWGKYGCKRNRQSEERPNMVTLSPRMIYRKPMSYQVLFVCVPS